MVAAYGPLWGIARRTISFIASTVFGFENAPWPRCTNPRNPPSSENTSSSVVAFSMFPKFERHCRALTAALVVPNDEEISGMLTIIPRQLAHGANIRPMQSHHVEHLRRAPR